MNRSFKLVPAALAILLAQPALSQQAQPQGDAEGATPQAAAPVAYSGQAITAAGTIESVDRETRTITFKDDQARILTIRADGDTVGFEDLEKGDKAILRYSEAMLITIAKSDGGGQPAAVPEAPVQDRTEGEPTAQAVEHARVVAKVADVAPDRSRITLVGPKDEEIILRVRDPQAMGDLQKGDAVIAAYVEALAISVQPQDDAGQAQAIEGPIEAPQPRAGEENEQPDTGEPR